MGEVVRGGVHAAAGRGPVPVAVKGDAAALVGRGGVRRRVGFGVGGGAQAEALRYVAADELGEGAAGVLLDALCEHVEGHVGVCHACVGRVDERALGEEFDVVWLNLDRCLLDCIELVKRCVTTYHSLRTAVDQDCRPAVCTLVCRWVHLQVECRRKDRLRSWIGHCPALIKKIILVTANIHTNPN